MTERENGERERGERGGRGRGDREGGAGGRKIEPLKMFLLTRVIE